MAFAHTTPEMIGKGAGMVMARGTYTNGVGDIGGNIVTGLKLVNYVFLTPNKDAVTSSHTYNVTLPLTNFTAVTIVTGDAEGGTYEIWGTW
jgi:hypothetical protein